MQAGDLEKVAKCLNVPISVFFDEGAGARVSTTGDFSPASVTGNATVAMGDAALMQRIADLEAQLEDKKEIIRLLKGDKQ